MTKTKNLPATTTPKNEVDTSRVGGVPFVTFMTPKSSRWAEVAAAIPGLKDGDIVLVRPAPECPVKLDTFRFHLLAAQQAWVDAEDDGTINSVTFQRPDKDDTKHKEVVEAAILVYAGNKILPARVSFRTTKCPAAIIASKALQLAQSPEWKEQSPAHAATLAIPDPSLRFTATVALQPQTARSGRKYVKATAAIAPIAVEAAKLIAEALNDPRFKSLVDAILAALEARISALEEKA